MAAIEDLVRRSLAQRAEDVEPTPELWREVDRRLSRRRRGIVAAWAFAGAAAVLAGLLVVSPLLDGADPRPEVEPLSPAPEEAPPTSDEDTPEEGTSEEPAPDGTIDEEGGTEQDPPSATEEPAAADPQATVDGVTLPEPVLVTTFRAVDVVGPDGRETVVELDPEGESWINGIAVQPGSTLDDYTAVVLSSAEGFWDLRHLHVVDGEVVTWEVVPERYRPRLSTEAIPGAEITGPVFSPDGDALAWVESTPEDVTLQVIGWDEGPGTGQPATDTARFSLDPSLGGYQLMDWVSAQAPDDGAITHWLRLASADAVGSWERVALQRQADGAWSLPSGARSSVDAGVKSSVPALAGIDADDQPGWLVRLHPSGGIDLDSSWWDEQAEGPVALPDGLVPADGVPTAWARETGDGVLVGSADTMSAVFVEADRQVHELPGRWAHVAVVHRHAQGELELRRDEP